MCWTKGVFTCKISYWYELHSGTSCQFSYRVHVKEHDMDVTKEGEE